MLHAWGGGHVEFRVVLSDSDELDRGSPCTVILNQTLLRTFASLLLILSWLL